jgi:hypothetical protein
MRPPSGQEGASQSHPCVTTGNHRADRPSCLSPVALPYPPPTLALPDKRAPVLVEAVPRAREWHLIRQFVAHSPQQLRHAKGLLEGLPCSEELRGIQDILFPSDA